MAFSLNFISIGFYRCKNFLEESWERDLRLLRFQPKKINDITFFPVLCDIVSDYVGVNYWRQILNID